MPPEITNIPIEEQDEFRDFAAENLTNAFLHNWEVEHKLDYLYPDGMVNSDAIDQIRIQYLKELELDDLS